MKELTESKTHNQIVKVLDYKEYKNDPDFPDSLIIIEEFCNGGDLDGKIEREKRIKDKEAKSILF